MNVAVVGLGLIGGSAAKAYKAGGHKVFAYDVDDSILDFSMLSKTVDEKLTDKNLADCDLVIIATYPQSAIKFLEEKAPLFSKNSVVIDFCGTKKKVCEAGFRLAKKYGFLYVGGHPMAGTHNSGFMYSKENMFKGAPMVIVPPKFDDIALLDKIAEFLKPLGIGKISVTTAERHDEMIAFTSQLAHIVSNAYIKSPTAKIHKGFSAGSYKDLTRVAWLNPTMWTELFLENKENLIKELDGLIKNLTEYKTAMENDDFDTLYKLLDDGRNIKKEVDG